MQRPDLRKNEIDICAADPENYPASAAILNAVNSLNVPDGTTVSLTVWADSKTRGVDNPSSNVVDVDTRLVRQMVEALAKDQRVVSVTATPGGTVYTRPAIQGGIDDVTLSEIEAGAR